VRPNFRIIDSKTELGGDMKTKNTLDARLAKLNSEHSSYIKLYYYSWASIIVSVILLFLLPATVLFFGGSWLWILPMGFAPVTVVFCFLLARFASTQIIIIAREFLKKINGRCFKPYVMNRLGDEQWHWVFINYASFELLAEYLIRESYPKKHKVENQELAEARLNWHKETDQTFSLALAELPNHAWKLRRRVRRAIGNYHMDSKDKQILLLSLHAYLWPDDENHSEVKNKLGNWFYQIPNEQAGQYLQGRIRSAVKSDEYRPKVKKPRSKSVTRKRSTKEIVPEISKASLPDVYLDLKHLKATEALSLEQLKDFVPQNFDHRLVWAVLVSLLEPGKSIAIGGGYMRKEALIHKGAARLFKQQKWNYPGHKCCTAVIEWLTREQVLQKRTHGRDFSLNFHVNGKNSPALEITQMLNIAKTESQWN